MPGKLTHYFHAKAVLPKMAVPILEERSFFWGAQGPDFMLFHRALPWLPGRPLRFAARILHRANPADAFGAMRTTLEQHTDFHEILKSYVAGLLCHYALDCIAHPFVNAEAARRARESGVKILPSVVHNMIECNLDVGLLQKKTGKRPHEFPLKRLFPGELDLLNIQAGLIRNTLTTLSGITVRQKKLVQAYRDAIRVSRFLTDNRYRKRRWIAAAERLFHTGPALSSLMYPEFPDETADYGNQSRRLWAEGRRESFDDLLDQSVTFAAELIDVFFAGGDLKTLTGSRNHKGEVC